MPKVTQIHRGGQTAAPGHRGGSRGTVAPPEQPLETETRRERFERLATARVRRVLKDLRLVGNLASDNYDYSEQDAALIEETLREQMDEVIARFRPKMKGSRGELSFSFGSAAQTEEA